MKPRKNWHNSKSDTDYYVVDAEDMGPDDFGEFGMIDYNAALTRDYALGRSDNPSLQMGLRIRKGATHDARLATVAHEFVHAYDYEVRQYGVSWAGANPTLDTSDEIRAFRREDVLFSSLPDVSPDDIDHRYVTTHGYAGLWRRARSIGLQSKLHRGNLMYFDFYRERLRVAGRLGLPLDEGQVLYNGWQDDYFTERLIHGQQLDF